MFQLLVILAIFARYISTACPALLSVRISAVDEWSATMNSIPFSGPHVTDTKIARDVGEPYKRVQDFSLYVEPSQIVIGIRVNGFSNQNAFITSVEYNGKKIPESFTGSQTSEWLYYSGSVPAGKWDSDFNYNTKDWVPVKELLRCSGSKFNNLTAVDGQNIANYVSKKSGHLFDKSEDIECGSTDGISTTAAWVGVKGCTISSTVYYRLAISLPSSPAPTCYSSKDVRSLTNSNNPFLSYTYGTGQSNTKTMDILLTADNQWDAYFAGYSAVGPLDSDYRTFPYDWSRIMRLTFNIVPGQYVLAVHAKDFGVIRAFIASITYDGRLYAVTNGWGDWKITNNVPKKGWNTDYDYDDNSWQTVDDNLLCNADISWRNIPNIMNLWGGCPQMLWSPNCISDKIYTDVYIIFKMDLVAKPTRDVLCGLHSEYIASSSASVFKKSVENYYSTSSADVYKSRVSVSNFRSTLSAAAYQSTVSSATASFSSSTAALQSTVSSVATLSTSSAAANQSTRTPASAGFSSTTAAYQSSISAATTSSLAANQSTVSPASTGLSSSTATDQTSVSSTYTLSTSSTATNQSTVTPTSTGFSSTATAYQSSISAATALSISSSAVNQSTFSPASAGFSSSTAALQSSVASAAALSASSAATNQSTVTPASAGFSSSTAAYLSSANMIFTSIANQSSVSSAIAFFFYSSSTTAYQSSASASTFVSTSSAAAYQSSVSADYYQSSSSNAESESVVKSTSSEASYQSDSSVDNMLSTSAPSSSNTIFSEGTTVSFNSSKEATDSLGDFSSEILDSASLSNYRTETSETTPLVTRTDTDANVTVYHPIDSDYFSYEMKIQTKSASDKRIYSLDKILNTPEKSLASKDSVSALASVGSLVPVAIIGALIGFLVFRRAQKLDVFNDFIRKDFGMGNMNPLYDRHDGFHENPLFSVPEDANSPANKSAIEVKFEFSFLK